MPRDDQAIGLAFLPDELRQRLRIASPIGERGGCAEARFGTWGKRVAALVGSK